ncbi:MAG: type II secretion system protein N [Syntrophaceae bacterium]
MPKRYQWLVHLAIVTVFIWVIVGIVSSITGHVFYKLPKPERSASVAVESHRRRPMDRGSYDIIKTRGLFDIQAKGALPAGGVDKDRDRPIAEMGISLKGTITGPESWARAIIDDKGKQQLYKIGDEIMGARVLAIFRNKVIMDVNGQEQQLVPDEPGGRKARGGRAMARAVPGSAPGGMPPSADMMQNMEEFLGRARVVPYFKGGEPYGFRISNVDNNSPLYGVGVRSGDVIRSVNGIPIRSPEDAFKAYQQLGSLSSVQVELERGGSSLSVTVPVK